MFERSERRDDDGGPVYSDIYNHRHFISCVCCLTDFVNDTDIYNWQWIAQRVFLDALWEYGIFAVCSTQRRLF